MRRISIPAADVRPGDIVFPHNYPVEITDNYGAPGSGRRYLQWAPDEGVSLHAEALVLVVRDVVVEGVWP